MHAPLHCRALDAVTGVNKSTPLTARNMLRSRAKSGEPKMQKNFGCCVALCQLLSLGCGGNGPQGTGGDSGAGHDSSVAGAAAVGGTGGSGGSAGSAGLGGFGSVGGFGGVGGLIANDAGPSGCVLPGEVNEFLLPLCADPMDATTPPPLCVPGVDEFGQPVCLDDAGVPLPPPLPRCVRGGLCEPLLLSGAGQLDILFVVDDSLSMLQEQAALVQEMPHFIQVLTSGDLDGDGTQDFAPARDLHLGVISTDMGIGGITGVTGCTGPGRDGVLRHTPATTVSGCASSYPTFLNYDATTVDPTQAATDFACIATLGTNGCGYEQQLEATLKAITPSTSDRRFHAIGDGSPTGHGTGLNAGFVRRDSLLAVILVTDEDDCSARETRLFTPTSMLPVGDPIREQDLNLRCSQNPDLLFPLSRYIEGIAEQRAPGSGLVIFSAITGVPPALVSETALGQVDSTDAAARDAFYDGILAAPEMQIAIDPATVAPNRNLTPSCITDTGRAYPPRRIVEVVKGFGEDGVVQSICDNNFARALSPVAERVSRALTVGCLAEDFARDNEGRVACDVVWELPPAGALNASLLLCDERSFLRAPDNRDERVSADGRIRCLMNQVPVMAGAAVTGESGFYYDDFSSAAVDQCGGASDQRIVFTDDIETPSDVRVYVDCEVNP